MTDRACVVVHIKQLRQTYCHSTETDALNGGRKRAPRFANRMHTLCRPFFFFPIFRSTVQKPRVVNGHTYRLFSSRNAFTLCRLFSPTFLGVVSPCTTPCFYFKTCARSSNLDRVKSFFSAFTAPDFSSFPKWEISRESFLRGEERMCGRNEKGAEFLFSLLPEASL